MHSALRWVVLALLVVNLVKRAASDNVKQKRQLRYLGIALLLIVASIPWPFRPGFEAYGWF
jgi:hypothetical protein